jgi:hypothetical protein
LWSISKDLENYVLPENRATFQALKPWLKPIPRDSVNDRVLVGETFFEQLQKRAELVGRLKNEKRRTLIIGSDPIEQMAVNKHSQKVLPSLMEDLLSEGVKSTDMARVFVMSIPGTYEHLLMRLLPDSSSAQSDTTIYPPLSALGGSDTTVLSEDPFGIGSQDTVNLFANITNRYKFLDSVNIETVVFNNEGNGEDWMAAVDTAMAEWDREWDGPDRSKSSFMSYRTRWGGRENSKLVFDIAYTQIQPTFQSKNLNAMRAVIGESKELNLNTQGISIGVNIRNGKKLQNHRLQIAQTLATKGDHYGATYVLYSDMTQFALGRFLSFGVGGFTGYGEQRYKKFTNTTGGFINQDQPSFVVTNPAYLYGLTAEPTLHVGPFYARITGGYAWDFGDGTWLYQNEPMNNGSNFKSTGWYVMAEAGLHWKFNQALFRSYSYESYDGYDEVAIDSAAAVGKKSPRTKERRAQK